MTPATVWLVEKETRWHSTSRTLLAVAETVEVAKDAADKSHNHPKVDGGIWCEYCRTKWQEIGPTYFAKKYTDDDVCYEYVVRETSVLTAKEIQ